MLLNAFLEQCRRQPNALALQELDRQLGYQKLLTQAQAVAAALQAFGVAAGEPVAIHLDRGIDAVTAVFGVLLAGSCYVPLDLKNPPARLSFIASDAAAKAVIGRGQPPAWLAAELWLDLDLCRGGERPIIERQSSDLAAILYTSGSTGQPRGVAISHGAIAAFADWAADLLKLNCCDRIASSAPLFFDLSTFDLYAVLGRGGSLHFLPGALSMAPARLSAWLSELAITGWYTVPSLLSFLTYKGNLAQTALDKLRFVIFAGEVFPTASLIDLAASLPHTDLYNFFGPTETNVCCYWPVERNRLQIEQTLPIGIPAAGCQLKINHDNGDLWVRGPTLASGYWRQGRLHDFLNAEGWYATGDQASLEQGLHRFHGRLGRMLKCSGYRVEPAEIEAVVNALPGVTACAVIGIADATAGQRPALAFVAAQELDTAEIRKFLNQRLPAYMQPSRYLSLPVLPLLANGKLDYRALAEFLAAPPADKVDSR